MAVTNNSIRLLYLDRELVRTCVLYNKVLYICMHGTSVDDKHIYIYKSEDSGTTWSSVSTGDIVSGNVISMGMDIDSNGVLHIAWRSYTSPEYAKYITYNIVTDSWGTEENAIAIDMNTTREVKICVDTNDYPHVIAARSSVGDGWYHCKRDGVWAGTVNNRGAREASNPVALSGGVIIVCDRHRIITNRLDEWVRSAAGVWTQTEIFTSGGSLSTADIAIHKSPDSDIVHLIYKQDNKIYYRQRSVLGAWGGAEEVAAKGDYGGAVDVNPNDVYVDMDGNIYVTYSVSTGVLVNDPQYYKKRVSGVWGAHQYILEPGVSSYTSPQDNRMSLIGSSAGLGIAHRVKNVIAPYTQTMIFSKTSDFDVVFTPTVTSIDPDNGYTGTSVDVDIIGTNFAAGCTVELQKGGEVSIVATDITIVSDTEITCTLDLTGAALGDWDVVVINAELDEGILDDGFTVLEIPSPTITGITPDIGGVNKLVTINGVNFGATQQNSKVFFAKGDQEFETNIYAWSDIQIQVFSPEIPDIGTWDILVRVVSNE